MFLSNSSSQLYAATSGPKALYPTSDIDHNTSTHSINSHLGLLAGELISNTQNGSIDGEKLCKQYSSFDSIEEQMWLSHW